MKKAEKDISSNPSNMLGRNCPGAEETASVFQRNLQPVSLRENHSFVSLRGKLPPVPLLESLHDLISEARMIRIDDGGADRSIALTTLTRLAALAEQAFDILGDPKRDTATANADSARSGRAASSKALKELGDLCLLVSAQLKANRGHCYRLSNEPGYLTVFSFFEQTEARLARLCAVGRDRDRIAEGSSTTRHADLCRNSLKVRHLLGRFRLRVATAAARRENLEQTLLSIGASFAWLHDQQDFCQVRASDRLAAEQLQEKILEWLRSADHDDREGRLIWEEISSFIALVDLINYRQAQVERDLAAVTDLIGLLGEVEPNTHVPEALAERLQFLLRLRTSATQPVATCRPLGMRGFA